MNRTPFMIAAATLSVAVSPALAEAIRAQIVAVSCPTTTACVAGTNAGVGSGVSGTSVAGRGVVGTATGSTYGMVARSRDSAGLRSVTGPGSAVVARNASADSATVYALQSGSGSALAGSSLSDDTSVNPAGVTATSASGVGLVATSTSGIGLSAIQPRWDGIDATSARYYGLVAEAASGAGISAYAGPSNYGEAAAVYADSIAGTSLHVESSSGYGIVSDSLGTGVAAQSKNGNGVDASGSYIGVIGRAPAQGYPIVANVDGGYPFYVDGAGDIRFTGTIGTFAHTAEGNVLAYGASVTTPTVEDAGSATLRGGIARVALDPAFARSIEGLGRYRIFLMPDGDTNGLFVSERDPAGFVIRETRGGRGSIAFDYRVVATTVGHGNERAAFVAERGGPHASLQTAKPPARPVARVR